MVEAASPTSPEAPSAAAGSGKADAATAAELKGAAECVVGSKVQTRQDKTGTITGVNGTMCQVQLDDGSKTSTLFWMLRKAGSGTSTTARLVTCNLPLLQPLRHHYQLHGLNMTGGSFFNTTCSLKK